MKKNLLVLFLSIMFLNVSHLVSQNLPLLGSDKIVRDELPAPISDRAGSWISWSHIASNYTMQGFDGAIQLFALQRFATTDLLNYHGMTLTKIQFLPTDATDLGGTATTASYTVVVYTGGSAAGGIYSAGTLVSSQAVSSVTYNEWNSVTLNTPVTINANQEMWFGIFVNITDGYPISYDDGTVVAGKGNIIGFEGDWAPAEDWGVEDVSNWNIKGFVDDGDPTNGVIDLGLQFLDDGVNQNAITSMNVPVGSDFETVFAVYNFQYGAASDDFINDTLHIDAYMDGTLIGTFSTGNQTIASGDGIWFDITAMTALDIHDRNYSGTHSFCYEVNASPAWTENDPVDNIGCIDVTFEPYSQYALTSSQTGNGTISPGSFSPVDWFSTSTFTITPDPCYHIGDVTVDGVSVLGQLNNSSYTFTQITANHNLHVTFVANTFTVAANVGAGGTISALPSTVNCGDNLTFQVVPDPCYAISSVVANGTILTGSNGQYTIPNINANVNIQVVFIASDYTVTSSLNNMMGGIVSAPSTIGCNETLNFTVVNNDCYSLDSVLVNGEIISSTGGVYSVPNVTSNISIQAFFSPISYTLNVSAGANGTISPNGTLTVACGVQQTFTITPNTNYHVHAIYLNGDSVASSTIYNIIPDADYTIYVDFALNNDNEYYITVNSNTGGTVTPTSTSAYLGENIEFIITPQPCYTFTATLDYVDITSQLVDNGNNTYSYFLNNIADHHVFTVTFTSNTFTIIATTDGNGTALPGNMTVDCGDNAFISFTPNTNFVVGTVTDNGNDVTHLVVNNNYTLTNITANHNIYVTFRDNSQIYYTITVINSDNTISPAGNVSVLAGASQPFVITAPTGLRIAQILVDNNDDMANATFDNPSLATYTFNNVVANHTLEAIYANSISDFETGNTICIFPNPATHTLTITHETAIDRITVYDVTGKMVLDKEPSDSKIDLDVTNLYSGIYIIKITIGDKIFNNKFIKQ